MSITISRTNILSRISNKSLIMLARSVVFILLLATTSYLDIVHFEKGDIERHEAVKEVLKVYGD